MAYKYTGNPKEKDNFHFLSFKVKDLLSYGKDDKIKNRQYNNDLLINYIEKNENIAKDKKVYYELINFYRNQKEMEFMKKDIRCLFFDFHFKKETGISLLEKNEFIKILTKQYKSNN